MKVGIKQTHKIGRGLFALQDIKKDEFIFYFKGKVIKDRDSARKLKCNLQVGPNLWIDPAKGSFGRYINHSCNPNAGVKGKIKIIAVRDIKLGDEVTLDYSITDDDPRWKLNCKCGSENCRHIIKSIQFLPKSLFNEYKEFTPQFLQKSYIKAN